MPRESGRARSDKGSKLYVQPSELARKLVKEMEDHKVSRPTGVSVCNCYTVYLCPADHERLGNRDREVLAKLEHHLSKHARAKKYEVPGDIAVSMVMDGDLAPGRFGILAERVDAAPVERRGPAVPAAAAPDRAAPASPNRSGEAAQLGLAPQTIVIRAGDRVREFNHGRVIVGRARDVDFRVDDSNVSRRHAAIYWADGCIVVEDLDSTNGTLVNGYPVTSTVLRPDDVLVIGDCRITVETR